MSKTFAAPKVDPEAVKRIQPILDSYKNMAVMSGFYKDKPVNFLIAIDDRNKSAIELYPIAIVVTEEMLPDCGDADNNKVTGIKVQ